MSEQICFYCKINPGHKPNNETLWNGFEDKDTKQLVCWECRDTHYRAKSETEFADMYSEYPVMIK
jgi:hypothetical protein